MPSPIFRVMPRRWLVLASGLLCLMGIVALSSLAGCSIWSMMFYIVRMPLLNPPLSLDMAELRRSIENCLPKPLGEFCRSVGFWLALRRRLRGEFEFTLTYLCINFLLPPSADMALSAACVR